MIMVLLWHKDVSLFNIFYYYYPTLDNLCDPSLEQQQGAMSVF